MKNCGIRIHNTLTNKLFVFVFYVNRVYVFYLKLHNQFQRTLEQQVTKREADVTAALSLHI